MSNNTKTKLVLVGGGHSHAIALKLWSKKSLTHVDTTLISNVEDTPYSGMLPGYVAGFYNYQETHINLPRLAKMAGIKLIIDRAIDLDLTSNRVICSNNNSVEFDYLSLDIGSTPKTSNIPGATKYAIAAKPVPLFLDAWQKLLTNAQNNLSLPLDIAIVGGGAGGVELALNMQACLKRIRGNNFVKNTKISLIHRGSRLLSNHNQKVSQLITKILQQKSIAVYLNREVTAIESDKVVIGNSLNIKANYTFWVTQADSPQWIKYSTLTLDSNGFISVNSYLQSVSHPYIFAAGDIATIKNNPRPKAGVFAVRQGKPLYENWLNVITKQPLLSYVPQDKYLALIGTGDGKAIASWSNFCWHSTLLWYLKDYIDRKFMNQFLG